MVNQISELLNSVIDENTLHQENIDVDVEKVLRLTHEKIENKEIKRKSGKQIGRIWKALIAAAIIVVLGCGVVAAKNLFSGIQNIEDEEVSDAWDLTGLVQTSGTGTTSSAKAVQYAVELHNGAYKWEADMTVSVIPPTAVLRDGTVYELTSGDCAESMLKNNKLFTQLYTATGETVVIEGAVKFEHILIEEDGKLLLGENGSSGFSKMREFGDIVWYAKNDQTIVYCIETISGWFGSCSEEAYQNYSWQNGYIIPDFSSMANHQYYDETVRVLCGGRKESAMGQAYEEWSDYVHSSEYSKAKEAYILSNGACSSYTLQHPEYEAFEVACEEHAEKLDEICEKYQLTKLTEMKFYDSREQMKQILGFDTVLTGKGASDEALSISGRAFADGSFYQEVDWYNPEASTGFEWSLYCTKSGTLNPYHVYVRTSGMEEWDYESANEVVMHICMSPTETYVFAELTNSYITIRIQRGSLAIPKLDWEALPKTELEDFLNEIDWNLLNR